VDAVSLCNGLTAKTDTADAPHATRKPETDPNFQCGSCHTLQVLSVTTRSTKAQVPKDTIVNKCHKPSAMHCK